MNITKEPNSKHRKNLVAKKVNQEVGKVYVPTSKRIICTSCAPGHNPHPMQCNRASKKEWFDVEVTYLGSDVFQLKFQADTKFNKHEHDPGRLIRHLEAYSGFPIRFEPTYQLLEIKSGDNVTSMFHLSDEPIGPCRIDYDGADSKMLGFS